MADHASGATHPPAGRLTGASPTAFDASFLAPMFSPLPTLRSLLSSLFTAPYDAVASGCGAACRSGAGGRRRLRLPSMIRNGRLSTKSMPIIQKTSL